MEPAQAAAARPAPWPEGGFSRERPGIAASPDGESGACGRDRGAAALRSGGGDAALRSGGGDADRFASNGSAVAGSVAPSARAVPRPPGATPGGRRATAGGPQVSPTEEGISLCGVAGTRQHRKDLEPAPLPGER